MNYLQLKFILIGCSVLFSSCVNYKPLPEIANLDHYSAPEEKDNDKEKFLKGEFLTKQDVIDSALKNNPVYKKKELEATAEQAEYYGALSSLSPVVSLNSNGLSGTYEGNIAANGMNALSTEEKAEAAKYETDNYRRLLNEDVTLSLNKLDEKEAEINILKSNEQFQNKMVGTSLQNLRYGKAAESDVLNFKINALLAKAEVIEYEKQYVKNSYALAATMGRTDSKLPGNIKLDGLHENSLINIDNLNSFKDSGDVLDLSAYLNLAIENRPDLKEKKALLKSLKYRLYGVMEEYGPDIDFDLSDKSSISVSRNINAGNIISNIRGKQADRNIEEEVLLKKWIEIVKEVRNNYVSLKANLAIRDAYYASLDVAEERRNEIENGYSKGIIDIAALNNAQETLVEVRQRFIKSEIGVSDARARLLTACGIQTDGSKKTSIATLNQAQQTFVDISNDYAEAIINTENSKVSLNAAVGVSE